MRLAGRLQHLEQVNEEEERCPDCPPESFIVCRDGREDFADPPPCATCGRAAVVEVIRVVRDRDFFGNADRLRGVGL